MPIKTYVTPLLKPVSRTRIIAPHLIIHSCWTVLAPALSKSELNKSNFLQGFGPAARARSLSRFRRTKARISWVLDLRQVPPAWIHQNRRMLGFPPPLRDPAEEADPHPTSTGARRNPGEFGPHSRLSGRPTRISRRPGTKPHHHEAATGLASRFCSTPRGGHI